jgi:hypothetical protein
MDRDTEIKLFSLNQRISELEFAISDAQSKADSDPSGDKCQGYLDLVLQYTSIKNAFEQEKLVLTS